MNPFKLNKSAQVLINEKSTSTRNPNKATEKDPVLTLAMMEKLKKAGET